MPDFQLELDGDGPMYEQIRKAFARKISVQDLKPGDRLPFEHELMEALSTSRMTVSRALQALADDGLIRRDTVANDARKSTLSLTAEGRRLVARIAPRSEAAYAEIEAAFGTERLRALLAELSALATSLDSPPDVGD